MTWKFLLLSFKFTYLHSHSCGFKDDMTGSISLRRKIKQPGNSKNSQTLGTSEVCHPQYSSSLFSCHNSVSGDGITVWRKFKIFLFVKYPKNDERYLKKCFNKSYIIPLCLLNSVGKISEISMIFELFLSSFLQSIFFNIHNKVSANISFSYLSMTYVLNIFFN